MIKPMRFVTGEMNTNFCEGGCTGELVHTENIYLSEGCHRTKWPKFLEEACFFMSKINFRQI